MSESGDGSNGDKKSAAALSAIAKLRGKAIKLLAGREHSEKELLQKLTRASARSAERARAGAQRAERSAQKQSASASQTSLDNGFDVGFDGAPSEQFESLSGDDAPKKGGKFSKNFEEFFAKNAQIAPQVFPQEERESAREMASANAQIAASALESLKADGYQSDRRYAESMTRHFAGRLSKSAIAGKLKAAGIGRDDIEEAMAQELGEEERDDFAVARGLWQSKFKNPPSDEKEKAKHVRFLQSRGFSISVALRVLRESGASVDES